MSNWKEVIARGEPYGIGNDLWHWCISDEEIIRCGNCKYFTQNNECINPIWTVTYAEGYPKLLCDDGFCAWGKKIG